MLADELAAYAPREEPPRPFQADVRAFYDQTPVQRSTAGDFDDEAADEMLAAIRERGQGLDIAGLPQRRLLANWGLLAENTGCPTVAGTLLLGAAPQRFLPHAYVSALSIPGSDIATPPMDQKRIEGGRSICSWAPSASWSSTCCAGIAFAAWSRKWSRSCRRRRCGKCW